MGSHEEDEMIRRASAGDGAALATLLQVYEDELLRYVSRRLPLKVRHIHGPEDIVQDTCFEACRLIGGFVSQGPGSFYRWLARIANLRIMAAIQKHRSRRTHAVSSSLAEHGSMLVALEQMVLYRRTPSRSATAHEFISKVEQSLERLSDDYRRVIVHRFIDGLSVDETAQRMNRNANNIYVLCSRALAALREQLESVSHYV